MARELEENLEYQGEREFEPYTMEEYEIDNSNYPMDIGEESYTDINSGELINPTMSSPSGATITEYEPSGATITEYAPSGATITEYSPSGQPAISFKVQPTGQYLYPFEDVLKGLPPYSVNEQILTQSFMPVQGNENVQYLKEYIIENNSFKQPGGLDLEKFMQEMEEIDKIVKDQGVFYTKTDGVTPQPKGGKQKERFDEAYQDVKDFKDIKKNIDAALLETKFENYNNNLESAMANYLTERMRQAINIYNQNPVMERVKTGWDEYGNERYENVPLYINCDTSGGSTLEEVRNCAMKSELEWFSKRAGRNLFNLEIPVRDY